jgi:hypothetical protein
MKSASWVCIGGYTVFGGYTFRMKAMIWLLSIAAVGVFGYLLWVWRQRWRDHRRGSEDRLASFVAQVRPAVPPPVDAPAPAVAPTPAADPSLPQQKLLLEAAAKAGEAGEPALSIQLYARLLARFPQSAFAAQARSAVEAQKQKLAKA